MDRLDRLRDSIRQLNSDAVQVMAAARRDMVRREGESQEEYSERLRPYLTHIDNLIYAAQAKHDQYIQALREQANED